MDILDEALGVLDEEEAQRHEKEQEKLKKPWKPQHRGRFRLSLQDSSYYDSRLFNSYRHFNRSRAFHGSKHSNSTTHLNSANDPVSAPSFSFSSPLPTASYPLCLCFQHFNYMYMYMYHTVRQTTNHFCTNSS